MKTLTVAARVIRQIIADRRTLALLILAPIFVLYLLNVVLNSALTRPKLEVINTPTELTTILKKKADVKFSNSKETAIKDLKKGKIDAVIILENGTLTTTVEGSDTSVTGAVSKTLSTSLSKYMNNTLKNSFHIEPMKTVFETLHGDVDASAFDTMAPTMMGFFIVFFVFTLAGIAFLRERISGTLDRLMATPIKRIEVVLGYFLGFGLFAVLQTFIIQLFMIFVLDVHVAGNIYFVLLINILLAFASLSLGTLLSVFANNELQLFQFLPIVIVPQVIFSGLFCLREAPIWVTTLSKIFPLTYGAHALSAVVVRGEGIAAIYQDILIITGYAILFLILNSIALKKYRKL